MMVLIPIVLNTDECIYIVGSGINHIETTNSGRAVICMNGGERFCTNYMIDYFLDMLKDYGFAVKKAGR